MDQRQNGLHIPPTLNDGASVEEFCIEGMQTNHNEGSSSIIDTQSAQSSFVGKRSPSGIKNNDQTHLKGVVFSLLILYYFPFQSLRTLFHKPTKKMEERKQVILT